MLRERTDASLRMLLMVVAVIGLVASIASPIAIRARRAAMPRPAASVQAARAAQQDYNGSARRPVATASMMGLTFVATDVAPAMSRDKKSQPESAR